MISSSNSYSVNITHMKLSCQDKEIMYIKALLLFSYALMILANQVAYQLSNLTAFMIWS